MKEKNKKRLLDNLRYIPLIIMAIAFICFALNYEKLSVKGILEYTPSNYFLAAAIMVVFFAIKSISIVMPLAILYISSSIIFPDFWPVIINFIGLFVVMTIPYFIGRFSGKDLVDKLILKYPKVGKIKDIKAKNQWLFVFIIKILGFIPNDVSSIVLGSFDTDYKAYIIPAVLAKTPMMLAQTLLGANITEPGNRGFKVAILIGILVFIFTIFIYWKNKDTLKS